jgi:2,4-dienoyl-CoA reductase-like NADH-dependent reductase (Old Yellow Enzyme family)
MMMTPAGSTLVLPCGLVLRNRLVRAAAFAGGSAAEQVATHAEVAAGGVALTTLAYTAVSPDGRTFASQLLLTGTSDAGVAAEVAAARATVRAVANAVHAHGALLCVQLTHAGGFAARELLPPASDGSPGVPFAPSPAWDPAAPWRWVREATQDEVARLVCDFAAAARGAVDDGGADGVEVHLGHGYLLSQWLCPALNWRSDGHGGSVQARLQFPLAVVRAVRAAIGPRRALFVKLNTDDGFVGGVTPDDVRTTVQALCAEPGLVDGLVPSAGFVSRNGFFMLRGRVPRDGMVRALARTSSAKAWALSWLGRWLVPELPFTPRFLADGARAVLDVARSAGVPVIPVGGYTELAHVEAALAEGFAAVQMARALIREPDLPRRWLTGADATPSRCIHCNVCVLAALDPQVPTRCPERPAESAGEGSQSRSVTEIPVPQRADLY